MKVDRVLRAIEKEAAAGKRFLPIVGPKKGAVIYLITRASRARKVLDLGTLVGYSALLLSKAVGKGGRVTTVENNPALAKEAQQNFKRAGVRNIRLVHGDAKAVMKGWKGRFDLILLDVWKEEYGTLLPECIRALRKEGVLLADNAMWDTDAVRMFRKVLERNRMLDSVVIPLQDGISMSVKKNG